MVYGDFKDLNRRTAAHKAFDIAEDPKCDDIHYVLSSIVYKCFD